MMFCAWMVMFPVLDIDYASQLLGFSFSGSTIFYENPPRMSS
jgi:hypothetical protein